MPANSRWDLIRRLRVKIDLKDMGWEDVEEIDVALDRNKWRVFVNTVVNLRFP